MSEISTVITYWHWWILAAILLVLELLVPATFFLWSGIAAIGIGLLLWLFPYLMLEYQVLIFSIASVISVFVAHHYLAKSSAQTDRPDLNQRGTEYIGQIFTLDTPIVNRRSRLNIGDGSWNIEGPDCPTGTKVKIIAVENTHLKVEPL